VAGPVVVAAVAFVVAAVVVAWHRDPVAAWGMALVARRMAVEPADSGMVAEQLNGRGLRRSQSVVVGPVAEAEGRNHQIRHQ